MVIHAFWPLWFQQLSVHQDYCWFLVLLGWGFALVFWWWHPQRASAWRWVPWVAGAGVFSAAVQFGIFNPPFDFFHDRLIPGTTDNYRPALISVDLLGDWLLAIGFAAMTAGWWWDLAERSGVRGGRWLALLVAGAAMIEHVVAPAFGGSALALLVVAAAILSARELARPIEKLALGTAATMPLFSTIGPVAAFLGLLQRSGPPTPMGLAAAIVSWLGALLVLVALVPDVIGMRARGGWAARWRGVRWVGLCAVAWLVCGLFYAHLTGRDNRAELHQNRLRVVAARAALVEPEMLQLLEGSLPLLGEIEWNDESGLVRISPETQQTAREISRRLWRERRSTPFIRGARLLVAADGWLIALASSRSTPSPGLVEVVRRLTPRDRVDWDAARNVVETSEVPEIGRPYFCRAAIAADDGRMRGWLEFEQEEFFQSIERKWRSGPLVITALGLVLGGTLLFQRRTEREREQALRAAAVQAESNRVKSAFLATVSHELRTPLQSLLGYGELLRSRVRGDARAEAWLGAVQQHGELMTRLVNDLIDLSAIDAGTLRLRPRALAPGELVCAAVEGLRVRAESKGLALTCVVDASVPPAVRIDGERLRQIVFNLVGNAVKFTDRGRVAVRLSAVIEGGVEKSSATDTRLIVEVRDSGPGIAPEAQAKLFTPFSRLPETAHKEGAGVGLALTAALCRAMEGEVCVESDGRSGATFVASMKAAIAAINELPAGGGTSVTLEGLRVLIVDDNTLIRDLFVEMLQQAGAVCSVAATAESALNTVRHGDIDVVVLDLALPGMSGVELVPQLRQLLPRVRVIGASAHAGDAERGAALNAGMEAFLSKPVTQADLVAAVAGRARTAAWGTSRANATGNAAAIWHATVMRQFEAEAGSLSARLALALHARDWRGVRTAAHYLANSAAAIGDQELLAVCDRAVRAAEVAAADGDEDAVDAVRRTVAELRAHLASPREV